MAGTREVWFGLCRPSRVFAKGWYSAKGVCSTLLAACTLGQNCRAITCHAFLVPGCCLVVTSAGARRLGVLLVHLGRQSQNLLHQVATMSSGRFSRFCNSGGPRHWAGAAIVSGTPVPCPLCNVLVPRQVSSTAVNIPEARAAPAWIGSRPRSVSALSGSRCGCGGCGGAGSQLRMSLIAASVSGSLCPFLACPSHVCLGGGVPGAVEGWSIAALCSGW